MGSHSVTDTSERAPPFTPASKPVLDLPTPEGWKAEAEGNAPAGNRIRSLSITSPTPYHHTNRATQPIVYLDSPKHLPFEGFSDKKIVHCIRAP